MRFTDQKIYNLVKGNFRPLNSLLISYFSRFDPLFGLLVSLDFIWEATDYVILKLRILLS